MIMILLKVRTTGAKSSQAESTAIKRYINVSTTVQLEHAAYFCMIAGSWNGTL